MDAASPEQLARPTPLPLCTSLHDDASMSSAERLFNLQLQFNLFPATYVHPSWLSSVGWAVCMQPADADLASSPFWMRGLSKALLRRWQLDRQFDCDFSEPAKRLALLDAATLIRLGGLAAALLVRERLRRIVNRADVEKLQQTLGAEAHRFALRWGKPLPALSVHVHEIILQRWGDSGPGADAWAEHSAALVASAVPTAASGVLGRMQLKFPYSWTHSNYPRLRLSDELRVGLAGLFLQIIAEEGGEWAWLFEIGSASSDAPTPALPRRPGEGQEGEQTQMELSPC